MVLNGQIRHGVGAGNIYPVDPATIAEMIGDRVGKSVSTIAGRIKGMILPSIAYEYSVDILAPAYAIASKTKVDELFLLNDPLLHNHGFAAFSNSTHWETPLGMVELSHRLDRIVGSDDSLKDLLKYDESKHDGEVGCELQLPFVQLLWDHSIRIVPISVGRVSPRLIASTLSKFLDPDDLVIASTTLSHDLPDKYAQEVDSLTIKKLLSKETEYFEENRGAVSSPGSVGILLELAREKNWKPELLDYSLIRVPSGEKEKNIGLASILFTG